MSRFVGLQVVLWAFSWAFSHNPRVAFAREVGVGAVVVFDVARGGPVLVGFEARCAWSGLGSTQPTWREVRGAPWLCPGGRSPGPVVRREVMVVGC